jgi:hypothetical protein
MAVATLLSSIQLDAWDGLTDGVVRTLRWVRGCSARVRKELGFALLNAASNGHAPVVQVLLADGRGDPLVNGGWALHAAAARNDLPVLRLLLADERVRPAAPDSLAVYCATRWGQADALRLLLADGRADPAARDNQALVVAVNGGSLTVLQALLADPRTNPADAVQAALDNEWTDAAAEALQFSAHVLRELRWRQRRRWLRVCVCARLRSGAA